TLMVTARPGPQDVRIVMMPQANQTPPTLACRLAPEFTVNHWSNSKTVLPDRFRWDAFRGSTVLLAFLDESKPSVRIQAQLDQFHAKWGEKLTLVKVYEAASGREPAGVSSPTITAMVQPGPWLGGYSEAFQKYGVRTTPTLVLIDRDGIVQEA